MNTHDTDNETRSFFAQVHAEREIFETTLQTVRANGEAALRRLLPIAQGDTGQSRRVACFLLGCYNGPRFPFDLTELRGLDFAIYEDCLRVLRMDYAPLKEIHNYFTDGGKLFEQLAQDWRLEEDTT